MKYLCAIVLLFLLSGCSDGIADSDDLSDLKLYVEEVKSRKPLEDPFGEGYIPISPQLPVFTPNDNPFDQGRPSAWSGTDEPDGKGGEFP